MKAAKLANSSRLKRVHDFLADGKEHTTLDIIDNTRVCAVNSIIGELRVNGAVIECRRAQGPNGPIWNYRMLETAWGRSVDPLLNL